MSEEIWRDISGYEGLYQVSNFGRVKSFYKGGRILKTVPDGGGYPIVCLSRDGKHKNRTVHRLVAEAFMPNPDGKPQVNHIDGDKTNNRADNLEWCTSTENNRHAIKTRLHGSGAATYNNAKLTNEQAFYVRENPDDLTQTKLAELFVVTTTVISYIQRGKSYRNAGGKIRTTKLPAPHRLPDDIREEIRRLHKPCSHEFGTYALALKFGVGATTIQRIIKEDAGDV